MITSIATPLRRARLFDAPFVAPPRVEDVFTRDVFTLVFLLERVEEAFDRERGVGASFTGQRI
ncbi:MAG: hypothetical protein AB7S26_12225 [Sandaracinaceae bacterium]